jgi:hypothetical protein
LRLGCSCDLFKGCPPLKESGSGCTSIFPKLLLIFGKGKEKGKKIRLGSNAEFLNILVFGIDS